MRLADVSGFDSGGFAFHDNSTLWHAHAFLFGYASAVVAGFSLTAVPNWTGRLPIRGCRCWRCFAFGSPVGLRCSCRLFPSPRPCGWCGLSSPFWPPYSPTPPPRETSATCPFARLCLYLRRANLVFHLEASGAIQPEGYAVRMGVGMLTLIGLIGGRIVPSFTNNWFARHRMSRDAASAVLLDRIVHASSAVAVLAWIAAPFSLFTAAAFVIAFAAHTARLAQWRGWRTHTDALVAVLHVGYTSESDRFSLARRLDCVGSACAVCGPSRVDRRRRRHDDAGGHDTRNTGPHGRQLHAGAGTITVYCAIHGKRGVAPSRCRVRTGFRRSAADDIGRCCGCSRVRVVRRDLWSDVSHTEVGRRAVASLTDDERRSCARRTSLALPAGRTAARRR